MNASTAPFAPLIDARLVRGCPPRLGEAAADEHGGADFEQATDRAHSIAIPARDRRAGDGVHLRQRRVRLTFDGAERSAHRQLVQVERQRARGAGGERRDRTQIRLPRLRATGGRIDRRERLAKLSARVREVAANVDGVSRGHDGRDTREGGERSRPRRVPGPTHAPTP